uniref:Uncharacterized protein n=1 Tax=Lepeophtheirus salmonis TaxID=72036 RepID=A0A0K2T7K6_LEPSM
MFPSILNKGLNTGTNRSTAGLDEVQGQVFPLLRGHSFQGIDIRVRRLVRLPSKTHQTLKSRVFKSCEDEGSHVQPAEKLYLLGRVCRVAVLGKYITVPWERNLQP